MKRWNGWGDQSKVASLPPAALPHLSALIGSAAPPRDATLSESIRRVPQSALPEDRRYVRDAEARLRHAAGQSFPDWLNLRSNRVPRFPDGVAFPETKEDLADLLALADHHGWLLIPYGGGSSVVGHINPPDGDRPVLTVSLGRLNRLEAFDSLSRLATFGAGVAGPDLEAQLRAHGFTLGHYPQSFEYSTLGGWVATRSSGQQSLGYGRIEDLFAGGELQTPAGPLNLPPFPASAAGADLRQLVLGSEGRLGIISQATVRVSPLPEKERFYAFFFPHFSAGHAAVRTIIQSGIPLSLLRLSNGTETETTLRMAGHERAIAALEALLRVRGVGDEKALLLTGFTGSADQVALSRRAVTAIARGEGGIFTGQQFGAAWHAGRFDTPYLRNTLWEIGYGVDTVETAVTWPQVESTMAAIETAMQSGAAACGERVHVYTHLSHTYPSGCSVYTSAIFRLAADPARTMTLWRTMKERASAAIVAAGGTISHQHGVGKDHLPYLQAEKGALGVELLRATAAALDRRGTLDNGNLFAAGGR